MKNKVILAVLCGYTLLVVPSVSGVFVSINGSAVYNADTTTDIPDDSFGSIGYFAEGFTDFSGLHGRSWSDVTASDYISIYSGSIVNGAGNLAASGSANGIEGKQLFIWVFDTLSTPGTIGAVEFGLFTGTSEDWKANADGFSPFLPNELFVSDVTVAEFDTDLGANIALAPIPEPSHVALALGIMGFGFAVFRRKKS